MSVDVSSEEAYAYAEIIEILSFTDINLVEKVPNKLISIFRNNALSTYQYHLNQDIPLENQELSSETATLLTLISLNYWCTPEEKKELQQILIENESTQKAEIEEKYSINNLFDNQQIENANTTYSEEKITVQDYTNDILPLDTSSLPWYKKIIIKFNEIFSKLIKK